MTTPNLHFGDELPQGVTTPQQLGSTLQDHTVGKYTNVTATRFPDVVSGTSAQSPANQAGPLGFIVDLHSRMTSTIANSSSTEITKPDDLLDLIPDFFDGLPLVSLIETIFEMLLGAFTGGAGATGFLAEIESFFTGQWAQQDSNSSAIVDLQSKTQQLEGVIGYGCSYMNNSTQWAIFQSSKPVHFDTQVGPIVGCTMDGTGYVLQSKGLWRADCQMTFDVYAVGNYAIDMDIVVLDPAGNVFARKNYHDVQSNYVTRTNIFSFVVPAAGYKVQVWSASGPGRGQLGGPVRTGFNVTKISSETS